MISRKRRRADNRREVGGPVPAGPRVPMVPVPIDLVLMSPRSCGPCPHSPGVPIVLMFMSPHPHGLGVPMVLVSPCPYIPMVLVSPYPHGLGVHVTIDWVYFSVSPHSPGVYVPTIPMSSQIWCPCHHVLTGCAHVSPSLCPYGPVPCGPGVLMFPCPLSPSPPRPGIQRPCSHGPGVPMVPMSPRHHRPAVPEVLVAMVHAPKSPQTWHPHDLDADVPLSPVYSVPQDGRAQRAAAASLAGGAGAEWPLPRAGVGRR